MSDERAQLSACLKAVTDRTPLITRGVVNASKATRPLSWRRDELRVAISQARALADELVLHQVQLGWLDRKGDVA